MLVTNYDHLMDASKHGYAVPAINTQGGNYDIIWAICQAAERLKSPVILSHYAPTGAYSGMDWFMEVSRWCAQKVGVPVSVHLDHGEDELICREAIELGFTSVMIDGSDKPLKDNAAVTNQVIRFASKAGIPVEAEIGKILTAEDCQRESHTSLEDVNQFLDLCHPDSLAIGIGNAHGYYKGKPRIRLEVLEQVHHYWKIPLVLHGCTGLSESVIKKAIQLGVSKINVGTEIRYKYLEYYQRGISELDHKGHSWKVSRYANEKLTEDIMKIIKLSGSEGKA